MPHFDTVSTYIAPKHFKIVKKKDIKRTVSMDITINW